MKEKELVKMIIEKLNTDGFKIEFVEKDKQGGYWGIKTEQRGFICLEGYSFMYDIQMINSVIHIG